MANRLSIISCAAACSAAGVAIAGTPANTVTVIYSDIPESPTSIVPAGTGMGISTRFDAFDRPYRSPNGLIWIMSADTDLATSEDEVIIVGEVGGPASTVVREGTEFGSPTEGETVGPIDRNLGLADSGAFSFTTNTSGGPSDSDEYVVLSSGNVFTAAAQEGSPVPGIADEIFGATLNSAWLLNDGVTVAFRATATVGLLGTAEDDFLILGDSITAQSAVTIPTGLAGGAVDPWGAFDSQDYYVDAAGETIIIQGDTTGATTADDIVTVNGFVVVQEGEVLGDSDFVSPVETPVEVAMVSNGDWFVRGDNVDQQDWVVRNGEVLAATGDPIVPGSLETFSDGPFAACFFWMNGNNNGDYIIGGTTSAVDPEADAVLVLNGETVILRQGDPVDLDGNGVADDDAFIDVFNNDDGFLTDDLKLYFTADLYDSKLVSLGQAFLVLDLNEGPVCETDLDGDGTTGAADLALLLGAWGECPKPEGVDPKCPADFDDDLFVNAADLAQLLGAWGPCDDGGKKKRPE